MDLLAGFSVVAGQRNAGKDSVRIVRRQSRSPTAAFREDQSPLLDLVHAIGQILADPTTDDTLALFQRLAKDKPQVLARLVGAGFRIKEIADAHPEAHIPADSTLWDEMLDVLVKIAQKPKLIEDVVRAFGDDRTLDLAKSGSAYMAMRDRPHLRPRATSTDRPSTQTRARSRRSRRPSIVRRPTPGTNRSAFQRFLQTLHDANGLSICTKPGAVAHIVWNGVAIDFPSFAAQAACFTLGARRPEEPDARSAACSASRTSPTTSSTPSSAR